MAIQHYFSSECLPTLWRVLPAVEELQTAWETKRDDDRFSMYSASIIDGLAKLQKYYSRLDEKPSYMLALGKFLFFISVRSLSDIRFLVLHPYYKLDYIEMAWGGADEQAKEITAGNLYAKNWQDEAKKIVEATVCNN
jgi:hypothetical protein